MTELEVEQLNQGRLLRDAGQVLLPILEAMKKAAIGRMCAYSREGQQQMLIPLAAELAVIVELETRITQSNNITAIREGRLHGQSTSGN